MQDKARTELFKSRKLRLERGQSSSVSMSLGNGGAGRGNGDGQNVERCSQRDPTLRNSNNVAYNHAFLAFAVLVDGSVSHYEGVGCLEMCDGDETPVRCFLYRSYGVGGGRKLLTRVVCCTV
jgi:hypothetical protein